MNNNFFVRWFKGTRDFARTPEGQLESQLIIMVCLTFGLFVGAWQQRVSGNGTIGFILFCFGLLQSFQIRPTYKRLQAAKKTTKLIVNLHRRG